MKRIVSIIMTAILCVTMLSLLPVTQQQASAATTNAWLQGRFAYLESVLPTGKYWNRVSGGTTVNLTGGAADYTTTITSSPCPTHENTGTCGAYCTNGGTGTMLSWQCFGFTDMLGYYLTGVRPWGNWKRIGAYSQPQSYSTKEQIMNNLMPGDILCYHVSSSEGHKVMVTSVNGDSISIVEANYGGRCQINRRTISRSAYLNNTIYYCLKYPGNSVYQAFVNKGQDGIYAPNENVIFNLNPNSYDTAHLLIYRTPPGGETYLYWEGQMVDPLPYVRSFPDEGYYSCCFEINKWSSDIYSEWVGWKVVDYHAVIDKGQNGIYAPNENVIFNLNPNSYDTAHLLIYRTPPGGETYLYWEGQMVNPLPYVRSFSDEGYYSCCFEINKWSSDVYSKWVAWHVVEPTIAVTGVTLDRTTATVEKGSTLSLTATVAPSNATNKNVTWTSSNTSVATVSSTGVVTAKANGTATITVTTEDGNKTASCAVTVVTYPTGITISDDAVKLIPGGTAQLTAAIIPEDASMKQIIWSSSDPNVVTVGQGLITGVSAGTATVTATSTYDSRITAACEVTVLRCLILPSNLIEIDDEAFMGCAASAIIIPEGCEDIGPSAFASCANLADIYIPASIVTISRTAFAGCSADLVIHGASGSVAQSFAAARGFRFEVYEP